MGIEIGDVFNVFVFFDVGFVLIVVFFDFMLVFVFLLCWNGIIKSVGIKRINVYSMDSVIMNCFIFSCFLFGI